MGISRVDFGGDTLVDLTQDTVVTTGLLRGATAHGANGELVQGTLDHDLILAKGKSTRVTVKLTTSDGTAYALGDGETLSMFLWYGEHDISATADGCVLDIVVPADADYDYMHYDVYMHRDGNIYLAVYSEADVVTGEACPQEIDGLVADYTKVCTSIADWKKNDYAVVDESATSIPSTAPSIAMARSIRLPNLTTTDDYQLYDLYAVRHCDFRSVSKAGSWFLADAYRIESVEFPSLKSADSGFLYGTCASSIEAPVCTTIGAQSVMLGHSLRHIRFPSLTALPANTFSAVGLSCANFPLVKTIASYVLQLAPIEIIILPSCTSIATKSFIYTIGLKTIVLSGSTMCTLAGTLWNKPPSEYTIYVNDSLVDSYKSATNWSAYATHIRPVSEWDGNIPD
jgi:hypothetical protein